MGTFRPQWGYPGWCPPTAPPPRLCCAAMWASMVSTPTCDFRCWQAAWWLKGFSFKGPKFGEWIQIVVGRNLLPNCKLNESIKGVENRVGIVTLVCRLILLGDLGGSCETLTTILDMFSVYVFFPHQFFYAGRSLNSSPPQKKTDFLPSVESLLLRRGVAIPQSMLVTWVPEKNQHANPETGPPTRPYRPYRHLGCDMVWHIPRQVCHELWVPAPF